MSETRRLAERIYAKVLEVAPHADKPKWDKWVKTLDTLMKGKKIGRKTVWEVFEWANQDPYWKTKILSADGLKKKFASLHAQMKPTPPKLVLAGSHKPHIAPKHVIGTIDSPQYQAFREAFKGLVSQMKI